MSAHTHFDALLVLVKELAFCSRGRSAMTRFVFGVGQRQRAASGRPQPVATHIGRQEEYKTQGARWRTKMHHFEGNFGNRFSIAMLIASSKAVRVAPGGLGLAPYFVDLKSNLNLGGGKQ